MRVPGIRPSFGLITVDSFTASVAVATKCEQKPAYGPLFR